MSQGTPWAWRAPAYLLGLLPLLTLLGWGGLAIWASAVGWDTVSWKLAVTSGASVALAASVLVVAIQTFVGNDRGLPAGQLAALARLSGKNDSDRGTDALKTVYSWREDQWRQLARGAAGVVVALLVAIVPLLLKQTSTETVYPVPDANVSFPAGTATMNGLPLTQTTVSGAGNSFPPALWVALADLLLLAVLAVMFERGAHRAYLRDVAELAERST
jgi:hypothetical protein